MSILQYCKLDFNLKLFIVGVEIHGPDIVSYINYKVLETGAKKVFLGEKVDKPGVLFGFIAYFVTEGDIEFQIWRPINEEHKLFTLVYRYAFAPNATNEDLNTRKVVCSITIACLYIYFF